MKEKKQVSYRKIAYFLIEVVLQYFCYNACSFQLCCFAHGLYGFSLSLQDRLNKFAPTCLLLCKETCEHSDFLFNAEESK